MTKSGKRIIDALHEANALPPDLVAFQAESNRIEGIILVRSREVDALQFFVNAPEIGIAEMRAYVAVVQPDARLRDDPSIRGVRVGMHIAPPSGPKLMADLAALLARVNASTILPHEAHCIFESLHPFTDGNGRIGRALWLWMRGGEAPLGFLHQFYYDALAAMDRRQ